MKKIVYSIAAALILMVGQAAAQDTTRITFKGKTIMVVEDESGDVEIDMSDLEDSLDLDHGDGKFRIGKSSCEEKGDKEIAHWAGFEMGANGFLTPGNSLTPDNGHLELDYARSFNYNLNLWEQKLPFFKGYGGIVTGLGFAFNNYHFKGSTNVFANNDSTWTVNNEGQNYTRNRLSATYVKVPLLLEFNTSLMEKKSFHIAAGVEGGYRIGSRTKQKFEVGGETHKLKVKDDYNLNPLKLSAVARIGYKNLSLFANYALTPLFEKNKGQEDLYAFEVGITLVDF